MPTTHPRLRLFDLPPARPEPRPAFVDIAECKRWILTLPATDIAVSNGALYTQLELLANFDLLSERRFELLELLRPRVLTVQVEHARKFRGRPAPLTPQRREALSEVASLWDALSRAYQRCVEGWARRGTDAGGGAATACHRAMDAIYRKLRDHHHAYVRPNASDYRLLNQLFAHAEREGYVRTRVKDPFDTSAPLSCQLALVRALLLEAATPREHAGAAISVIERWVDAWSPRVTVHATRPETLAAPPLFVRLDQARGVERQASGGPATRLIDVSALAVVLEKRIHALRHGKKLAELDLGNDLSKRDFELLLVSLHRQWCEPVQRRQQEREKVESLAHVSTGIPAAHFYLSRRPFEQPFAASALPARDTLGADTIRVKAATDYMQANRILVEQWIVRDESLNGIGLVRPMSESERARLIHGMLVSVRPRGGGPVLVGTIQWLEEVLAGDLRVGLKLLPGVPAAIAARRLGDDPFSPALMLAPIPQLNAPSAVVLPPGSYARDRIVELFDQGLRRIQLTGLLDSGPDHQRVAFMPAGSGDAIT